MVSRPARPSAAGPVAAAGPYGRVLSCDHNLLSAAGLGVGAGANALLALHRVAFVDTGTGRIDKAAARALLRWAAEHDLGQDRQLVADAAARRERALAGPRARGEAVRLLVTPEWHLAVGLGNRTNPHEIGLSLHGTYGWPVIPGSSVKGLTVRAAEDAHRGAGQDRQTQERLDRIFGTPRSGKGAGQDRRGSVCFLDALPYREPVRVAVDVTTPHVHPYYGDRSGRIPPAEHHNPVPTEFLVVDDGSFAVDLLGPQPDVEQAAGWCEQAFTELGAGAKTSAGYGYGTVARAETGR